MKRLILTNAYVWSGEGFSHSDLTIEGERIAAITAAGEVVTPEDIPTIDCHGAALLPGFVDLHVHFREPGYEYKETIKGGSEAAAAGGFTTVCTMPNLNPAPDSPENLAIQLEAIKRDAVIEVRPYATITRGRRGKEPIEFESLRPLVAGFSDDGNGIQEEETMRTAMKKASAAGAMIAAHCEVNDLLRGGYIHDGEYARLHGHRGICSESEWREVERNIRLAEETGARLHICHVSTKESIQLVREGKKRGVKVTCETAPHYLIFTDADLQEEGRFKMNPPIRSASDRAALLEAAADGTLDAIATDHAPHSAEEKSRGLEKSAMGVVGLETAFPATLTALGDALGIKRVVELMADTPRRILGMTDGPVGGIHKGDIADLVLVDPDGEYTVDSTKFHGKGRATPFDGMTLRGKVLLTIAKGNTVYKAE